MKHKNVYPPLQLINEINNMWPRAWEQMAIFHRDNGKGILPRWADWCYAPIAAAMGVICDGIDYDDLNYKGQEFVVYKSAMLHALAPWRLSKEVYVIDPDLKELLFEDPTDIEIPCEILLQLPYYSFYVEVPSLVLGDSKYHGFFVTLEDDIKNGDKELRFVFVKENGSYWGYPIHIDEGTIYGSMKRTIEQCNDRLRKYSESEQKFFQNEENQKKLSLFMGQCLQLVLYILAQNADIVSDPEQKTITKRGKTIKDKYSEIRKWDVGFRIGSDIRKIKSLPSDYQGGTHNSPRPHIRRGHWHHFWTGPKNDQSQRKLVLKWLSPMAIAVGDDEDSPVVIHKVK